MSGGHFNYDQYKIGGISDEVIQLIRDNASAEVNEYGDKVSRGYSEDTIAEFETAVYLLRLASVYVQRIDWLVCSEKCRAILDCTSMHKCRACLEKHGESIQDVREKYRGKLIHEIIKERNANECGNMCAGGGCCVGAVPVHSGVHDGREEVAHE
jgi:hypothetical protein